MPPVPHARRRLAGLLAASLCTFALGSAVAAVPASASTPSKAASPSIRSANQLTASQASFQARETGKAVAVTAAETSTEQLTANANGSFTLNESVEPIRKRVNGTWSPLDATLRLDRVTGVISPAVTTDGLTLSPGGHGPLAVMRSGNTSLTLSLPTDLGTLPVPTLSGDTATYANVLPGVNLEMTADTQGGYQEVLVVRNAAAAANPALKSLVFPASATGATLSSDAAGNISVKTPQGQTVFSAPEPLMWDSNAPAKGRAVHQATDPIDGLKVDTATGQPVSSSAAQPGEGARVARVGARADTRTVTLVPDTSMLTSSATKWPVYIDPSYAAGGNNQDWTFVDSYDDTASFWKNTGATAMHVGDENWDGPYSVDRTFVQLPVPSVLDNPSTHVTGSTFYATETWSASCTSEPVQLWWTGGISSSTTWNNQPAWNSQVSSDNIASGWNSPTNACPAASIGWSATSLMQQAAGSSPEWPNVTLGLRAGNESNGLNWEEFDPSTMSMSTTYTVTPNTPSVLGTSPATSCTGSVTTLGNGSVTLLAQVNSSAGGKVTADFKSWETASSGTAVDDGAVAATSSSSGYNAALLIPESTLFKLDSTTPLEVSWDVSVTDGTMTSGTSKTCSFIFNPASPGAPSVNDSATPPVDCSSSAGLYTVGVPATFTIVPNAAGATPTSYLYQLNGGGAVTTPASLSTITVVPTRRTNVLTVTAVAAGGNLGNSATCVINAAPAATAADGDLNGDGSPDLIAVGDQVGLPPGLWLNSGQGAGGQIATSSSDIGVQGIGHDTSIDSTSPSQWNGVQAFTGHFNSEGNGFNDVMDYNPADGVSEILHGTGDGSALQIAGAQSVNSSVFEDTSTTTYATHVANAGNLNNTASGNTDANGNIMVSYPDLLMTIDGGLYLQPSSAAGAGGYNAFGTSSTPNAIPLLPNNPTGGTSTWDGWTITTSLVATTNYTDLPALFARDDSTGALYYYSPTDMEELAENAIVGDSYTVTPALLASSSWTAAAYPSLQAADISSGGNPGLWAVSTSGTVTAVTLTGATVAATTATSTTTSTSATQPLTADSHTWPLDDGASTGTEVTSAADTTGNPSALTLSPYPSNAANATWNTKDPSFPADVVFNGAKGVLTTGASAVPLNNSFTVSAWVKPTTNQTTVLSQNGQDDSAMMLAATSSGWQFALNNQSGTGWSFDSIYGGTVDLGTWAHLTATYNQANGVMNLYVDGVYVATGTHAPSTSNDAANSDLMLGAALNTDSNVTFFSGEMADVETWSGSVIPPAQPFSPPSYHQSVTATRILDTRTGGKLTYTSGITAGSSTVAADAITQLDIANDLVTPSSSGGPAALPPTLTPVAADITAANESQAGYVTAYADGTQRPITSSTNYTAGDTVTGYQIVPVGSDGKIDLYNGSSGTTALIVDLTGYFVADPQDAYTGDQTYTPLATATRALDTRVSTSGTTGLTAVGTVPAETPFTLQITGTNGVPATATAVAANLTTADQTGGGYLEAYATGSTPLSMTSLTYSTADAISSMAADIPLNSTGNITIYNHGSAAAVIVDISGYYTTSTTGQTYHAVSPTRLLDTRDGTTNTTATPVAAGGTYTISQAATQQITTATQPTLATMLTVTNDSAVGNVIAYETGTTQPTTSNLNWNANQPVANLALTPTSTGGQISIYNHSAATIDLIVDCSGYFA